MKPFRITGNIKKTISVFITVAMVWISFPHGYASAAIIGTEAIANSLNGQQARSRIQGVIARKEIRNILIGQGVNIEEAKNRISSLSDAEAIRLANEIDQLPAGGDVWSALIVGSLIVFFVLLVTDIVGYTDVFPFVKKVK